MFGLFPRYCTSITCNYLCTSVNPKDVCEVHLVPAECLLEPSTDTQLRLVAAVEAERYRAAKVYKIILQV